MKYYDYRNIPNRMPQQIVWACDYEHTSTKESMHYCAKPIKGMLTVTCYKDKEMNRISENLQRYNATNPSFFIPFKKNAHGTTLDDLAWSKAVRTNSRLYTDTEDESIEIYNEKVITTVKRILRIAQNDAKEIINANISDDEKKMLDILTNLI